MQRIALPVIILFLALQLNAQVGIGTTQPHPAAALHIESNSMGLIIPIVSDVSNIKLDTITDPATIERGKGLMAFQSTDSTYYFWNGKDWHCATPFKVEKDKGVVKTSAEYPTVEGNFRGNVSGNLDASGNNTFSGNGTVPVGGIIMWTKTTLPTHGSWAYCDGTQGTPDLRGRFIVGYAPNVTDYNSTGKIGGSNSVKLTASETALVSHNHSVSGSTANDGTHKHNARGSQQYDTKNGDGRAARTEWNNLNEDLGGGSGPVTRTDGKHSHAINFTSGPAAQNVATSAHENRPPYYVLAFIMRVK